MSIPADNPDHWSLPVHESLTNLFRVAEELGWGIRDYKVDAPVGDLTKLEVKMIYRGPKAVRHELPEQRPDRY